MRALALVLSVALGSAGCAQLLGLEDPTQPDGGGCHRTCDLENNCGCTSAQTCSWNSSSGDQTCRETSGSSSLGQGCATADDCVLGTDCLFGECRRYCFSDDQCGSTLCKADFTPFAPTTVCSDACTPLTDAGCPSTLACLIIQGVDQAFCSGGDTIALGSDCSANVFGCVTGALCYHMGARSRAVRSAIRAGRPARPAPARRSRT